ncbi:MAG TPA: DUF4288 domain-containing protein [Archangium sp.]|uniref:DUF4288 domain-containing protein n=1 Tax=Archangium sp. TaxID=1872627 RepID=UPI002E32C3C8|nr:DUF4288 domain-containing protein [Archangium sp.]HEX5751224.1 DUF4288 domain-containing protein [Archangium sp.]
MAWYAASVVMYFQLKDEPQDDFYIWENVYLIDAPDSAEARRKAEYFGRLEEGDDDGTLTWNGRPAKQVYGGIRKLLTCAPSLTSRTGDSETIEDGTEATFSAFMVSSRKELEAFIRGESVQVTYEE